jgi:hypothetical protein
MRATCLVAASQRAAELLEAGKKACEPIGFAWFRRHAGLVPSRMASRARRYFFSMPSFRRNGSSERLRPRNFSMDSFTSRESPGS